jgi:hypothetical protein
MTSKLKVTSRITLSGIPGCQEDIEITRDQAFELYNELKNILGLHDFTPYPTGIRNPGILDRSPWQVPPTVTYGTTLLTNSDNSIKARSSDEQ